VSAAYGIPLRRSRGVALLMVLWLIVLMSVLAVGVVRVVGAETRSLATHLNRAAVRAAAEAGVNRAILELLAPVPRWLTDGTTQSFEFGGHTMLVSIRSTGGLVDLNRADERLIDAVLRLAALSDADRGQLVAAVLDWRDTDDFVRLNGAEAADYAFAGLGWGPRNGPFKSIEELRYVRGMTMVTYRAVAPLLTVHSGRSGVELEYAPPVLVEVLTGQKMIADEVTAPHGASRARATFHITVVLPFSAGAEFEVTTVVRISPERGHCCSTLSRREHVRPVSRVEGMVLP